MDISYFLVQSRLEWKSMSVFSCAAVSLRTPLRLLQVSHLRWEVRFITDSVAELEEMLRCWEVRTAKQGLLRFSTKSSHWRKSWQGFSCVAHRHFGKQTEEISLLPFKLNENIKASEGDSSSFQPCVFLSVLNEYKKQFQKQLCRWEWTGFWTFQK